MLKDFLKYLLEFPLRRKIVFSIVKIFLLGVPPSFFGLLQFGYAQDKPPEWVLIVKEFFAVHWVLFILAFCLPIVIGLTLSLWEQFSYYLKEKSAFDSNELVAILRSLDEIVSFKLERFTKVAYGLIGKTRNKEEVFEEITQPDKQVEYIISQLHNALRILTKDDTLRIVLVKLNQNIPVEIYQHMPLSSKPSFDLVGDLSKKTLFFDTAKDKEIKVIPSIKKHLTKPKRKPMYAPSDNATSKSGSIISFPIHHNGNKSLPYVLTIKSDVENRIDDDFRKKYSFIVDLFIKRICLEHSLKMIKEPA